VRGRASGAHYSSSRRIPVVVGVDGAGRLKEGSRVYLFMPTGPYGAIAEQTVVPAARRLRLPDALDDVTAAAIANPGMSSWVAYTERAKLKQGETVLINGATGASPAGFQIAVRSTPLSEVAKAWPGGDSDRRTVFTLDLQKN
jgi:NADPH:quinone reductase-like Zn-dependent oxidoreductase